MSRRETLRTQIPRRREPWNPTLARIGFLGSWQFACARMGHPAVTLDWVVVLPHIRRGRECVGQPHVNQNCTPPMATWNWSPPV